MGVTNMQPGECKMISKPGGSSFVRLFGGICLTCRVIRAAATSKAQQRHVQQQHLQQQQQQQQQRRQIALRLLMKVAASLRWQTHRLYDD